MTQKYQDDKKKQKQNKTKQNKKRQNKKEKQKKKSLPRLNRNKMKNDYNYLEILYKKLWKNGEKTKWVKFIEKCRK